MSETALTTLLVWIAILTFWIGWTVGYLTAKIGEKPKNNPNQKNKIL